MDFSKLRTRMIAIGAAAFLGMVALAVINAAMARADAFKQRRALLQSVVESARGQLAYYAGLEQSGKLDRTAAQAQAKESLRNTRFLGKEYFFVYTNEGMCVLLPPRVEWEGTPRADEVDKHGFRFIEALTNAGKSGGGFIEYYFPRAGGTEALPKLSYALGVQEWGWVVGTGLYVDDIESAFRADLARSLAVAVAIAALVFGLIFAIGRAVLRQVGGEPAEAVAVMRRVASGDLRVELRNAAPGSMLAELGVLIGRLRETLAELALQATNVGTASVEIVQTAGEVADSARLQNDSTQAMAAAMEELTVSVGHISDNARDTEMKAADAATKARKGHENIVETTQEMRTLARTVDDASTRIGSLSQLANEVGSMASSINEIAAQTNLLALNAAIEAARAGEQGRGFAVVADEVRKLAERTTKATIDIERMVGSIQTETESVVTVMGTVSQQVGSGVASSEKSATLLEDIANDATQASSRVSEVANSTREQSTVSAALAGQVEEVARLVETTSHAMHETAQAARDLEQVASRLNVVVAHFQT